MGSTVIVRLITKFQGVHIVLSDGFVAIGGKVDAHIQRADGHRDIKDVLGRGQDFECVEVCRAQRDVLWDSVALLVFWDDDRVILGLVVDGVVPGSRLVPG